MSELILVGRSSSHFTRTARIFALELGVPHAFRPVLDIMSLDPATFAGNPALKIPVLVDERGPLFGTENICRELARRSTIRSGVFLRGDIEERSIANAEEMTLHAMSTQVTLITAKLAGGASPPAKVLRSLENTLRYLDDHVDRMLDALPKDRTITFLEVSLFCLVTHLPFRQTLDAAGYERLNAFCDRFGHREGARRTPYCFDAA